MQIQNLFTKMRCVRYILYFRLLFWEAMTLNQNKTRILTTKEALETRKWFLLDASGKTLGRFAAEVAKILRGKHRPDFTPHVDCGDGVVIINAEKIAVTGMKKARKIYRSYTGFIGGMRETPFETLLARKPAYILERAIKGMMPKTRLGGQQVKKLRIYAGTDHQMKAQNPIPVNI